MHLGSFIPVPLPVHHVAGEFHILDDLGDAERRRAAHQSDRLVEPAIRYAPGEFESAGSGSYCADSARRARRGRPDVARIASSSAQASMSDLPDRCAYSRCQ